MRHIHDDLSHRQRTILKLRCYFGRGPAEIQRHLAVSERLYRRELEHAFEYVAARLELRCCEGRRAAIVALATGAATPYRDATRRHVATCRECGRWASALHGAARRAGDAVATPAQGRRLASRVEPAAACVAAAVVACTGVSHASPKLAGDGPGAAPAAAPAAAAVVSSDPEPGRRRAGRDEFRPERRSRRGPPPRPVTTEPEFAPAPVPERRPVAVPLVQPTPEELEFGLEGP